MFSLSKLPCFVLQNSLEDMLEQNFLSFQDLDSFSVIPLMSLNVEIYKHSILVSTQRNNVPTN